MKRCNSRRISHCLGLGLLAGAVQLAWAAPAGTPEAKAIIFSETFENAAQANPGLGQALMLDAYTSTATDASGTPFGANYTAVGQLPPPPGNIAGYSPVPFWLNKQFCNGMWLGADPANTPAPNGGLPINTYAPYGSTPTLVAPTLPATTPAQYCFSRSNTALPQAWDNLKVLANVLGQIENPSAKPSAAISNHAIAAFTQLPRDLANPNTPLVQFATAKPVQIPPGGRFITTSVAMAAMNCAPAGNAALQQQRSPSFDLYLVNDGKQMFNAAGQDPVKLTTTPIMVCETGKRFLPGTDDNGNLPSAPILTEGYSIQPANFEQGVRALQFVGDLPVLVPGSAVSMQMVNNNASGGGNDAAFDNVQIIDLTPKVDQAFAVPTLPNGGSTTLTYTITNRDDLLPKSGWSFSNTLPAGLQFDPGAAPVVNCPAPTKAEFVNGNLLVTGGELSGGMASCTIEAKVIALVSALPPAGVTLTNVPPSTDRVTPNNFTTMLGLDLPQPAAVQVVPAVADIAATPDSKKIVSVGTPVTVVTNCTNVGNEPARNATCVVTGEPADATNVVKSCTPASGSGDLAPGASIQCTTTFTPTRNGTVSLVTTAGMTNVDSDPSNNVAPTPVVVTVNALDLAAQAPTSVPGTVGTPVSVTSVCSNGGNQAASNASCTVTGAPAGAQTVCTPTSPVASLAVGDQISCVTTFTPTSNTPITLTTVAATSDTEADLTNNTAKTVVQFASVGQPAAVPTLGHGALAFLAGGMGFLAWRRQKKQVH